LIGLEERMKTGLDAIKNKTIGEILAIRRSMNNQQEDEELCFRPLKETKKTTSPKVTTQNLQQLPLVGFKLNWGNPKKEKDKKLFEEMGVEIL
jgi:hypothetical protein